MGTDRGYAVDKWLPICQWDSAAGGAPVYRLRLSSQPSFPSIQVGWQPGS
jgi:hypothetical protein